MLKYFPSKLTLAQESHVVRNWELKHTCDVIVQGGSFLGTALYFNQWNESNNSNISLRGKKCYILKISVLVTNSCDCNSNRVAWVRDFNLYRYMCVQSTPVISRLLGAKIRERELSGSPVISHFRAMAMTREFRLTDPHPGAYNSTTLKQYVER